MLRLALSRGSVVKSLDIGLLLVTYYLAVEVTGLALSF